MSLLIAPRRSHEHALCVVSFLATRKLRRARTLIWIGIQKVVRRYDRSGRLLRATKMNINSYAVSMIQTSTRYLRTYKYPSPIKHPSADRNTKQTNLCFTKTNIYCSVLLGALWYKYVHQYLRCFCDRWYQHTYAYLSTRLCTTT